MTPEEIYDAFDTSSVYVHTMLSMHRLEYSTARELSMELKDHHVTTGTQNDAFRHLLWMCTKGKEFVNRGDIEKASRWLGFIQGCLWSLGVVSINDLRYVNKPNVANL